MATAKQTERINQVCQQLLAAGWLEAGTTRPEIMRVPTQRSPLLGGTGGELRTFGGRTRFELPNTAYRVTVGAQTTCFYRVVNGQATDFTNYRTSDTNGIETALLATMLHSQPASERITTAGRTSYPVMQDLE